MASDSVAPDRRTATDLLWDPPLAAAHGPRPSMSLGAIARAGIAIADKAGLSGLTMQRVATELSFTKMSLYRYVPGKVEMVALMVDEALGEPDSLEVVSGIWRPKLDHWVRQLHDRFQRHPWFVEATTGPRSVGPLELRWIEQAVAAQAGLNMTSSEKMDLIETMIGHARNVAGASATDAAEGSGSQQSNAFEVLVAGREDQFPSLAEALTTADGDGAQGQPIDFGLQRILDGVELLLYERRR